MAFDKPPTTTLSPPPDARSAAVQSDSVDDLVAAYGELDAVLDRIAELSADRCTDVEVVALAKANEVAGRRIASLGHRRLMDVSDRDAWRLTGAATMRMFVANHLGVPDVKRRLDHAAALSETYTITGLQQPPELSATADALAEGAIAPEHVSVILDITNRIPASVEIDDHVAAEVALAEHARTLSPSALRQVGVRLLAHLDPDGELTDDHDRARQRSMTLSRQDAQLMSKLTATLDPVTRAMLDVVLAKWAAPGMNNPDDPNSPSGSIDDADPDSEVIKDAAQRDSRSQGQRNHDALNALLKCVLEGGALGGSHRGLPPQLIISITETQLRESAGLGVTATGADLPWRDVVELAAKADPHLAVFADHTEEVLYFGRARRTASRAQRMALFARDRGCTAPDCDQPAMHSEAHHLIDWAEGGRTDIDDLGVACPKHNRAAGPRRDQWTTRLDRATGRVTWTPPATSEPTNGPPEPRINNRHHPDRVLVCTRRPKPG
ncbi:HNH endonuclease signature motif containing protein [Gordonia soli]|nr:HNH endonuclease signature motif containing protein [Gordonia soli]